MNRYNLEKLQAELMVSGYQLLHDTGVPTHTREAQRIVSTWARINADVLTRRLRL